MPFIPIRGGNIRLRVSADSGTNWKLVDCEVDGSLDISSDQLDAPCKGEFFDTVEVGRSSGTGTINMIASDAKVSAANIIYSYLIDQQLKFTKLKFEFTQVKDDGSPLDTPVFIRGDGYVTDTSFTWEDHAFVSPSFTITFSDVIEHS